MSRNTPLVHHVRNIARTTSITTAATTAAVTALSKLQTGHPAAALNAVSHIVWGDDATRVDRVDGPHTLVGAAANASAMGMWAVINETLPRARTPVGATVKGLLLSATAYVVDYYVVPKRLTPGFELRLSPFGMFITYGVLAGAFAYSDYRASGGERADS